MDSLIVAAGRALALGDALGALKLVSLREDASALALRGIAMAQLGEHGRARELLRRATRRFGVHEQSARARCVVAEAEIALAMRDLRGSPQTLSSAAITLAGHHDRANATHARLIAVRRLLLLGRLDEAASALARLDLHGLPSSLQAVAGLAEAELALRRLRTAPAEAALARAQRAAERAGVPALLAEVAEARAALDRPAARRIHTDRDQPLRLRDVECLLASGALVVDACRRGLHAGHAGLSLARRPLLFELARRLAAAWPGDVERNALITHLFRIRRPDETHRARLRVEIGRLRALIAPLARIEASKHGFVLTPAGAPEVMVIVPPIEGEQASMLALLGDGAAWSTHALALAIGASQRSVQRALVDLESAGRVRSIGRGRAQRWLSPPVTGFATNLLLPTSPPSG